MGLPIVIEPSPVAEDLASSAAGGDRDPDADPQSVDAGRDGRVDDGVTTGAVVPNGGEAPTTAVDLAAGTDLEPAPTAAIDVAAGTDVEATAATDAVAVDSVVEEPAADTSVTDAPVADAPVTDAPVTDVEVVEAEAETLVEREAETGTVVSGGDGPGRGRKPLIDVRVVLAALATVALLVGAYVLGRGSGDDDGAATPTTQAQETTTTAEEELVEFRDEQAGFSLSYPEEWERLDITGATPDVRLVLSAGGMNSLLVRVVPLTGEVTEANLADLNAVTDSVINESEVTVLYEDEVTISGMPGYFYLYTFD
ncbi:MAG: hypothetical protein LC708_04095, partial [Actinobacteria bacterium]|nr:hypothetical protein [Actinomycetota bacterium]